jgi:hypothetical protein
MVKIIILLFAFVVLAYFAISFFNSYKRRKLEQKLENYQRLLEQARRSRLIYIRALKMAENVKFQIDAIENELASIKSKLQEFRPDLRNQLLELRRFRFSDNVFDSDLKIIEKKNTAFFSTWKAANALKASYNLKLDEAKILHNSFASLSEDSRGKTEIWHNDKRIVMKMYGELRSEVKISDPREVLLKGTNE